MRFMMLYGTAGAGDGQVVDGLLEEMARAGVLLATDRCRATSPGTRVRLCGGDFEVTDEAVVPGEDVPGGYAIVQVSTRERAVELAKRFLAVAGGLAGEIRLLPA